MIELLADRATAGVRVRLLYDDFGSITTPRDHFEPLLEAGGEVAAYGSLQLRFRLARSRLNFRNHRKILTVDGHHGFVGGLNVANEYRGTDRRGREWNDMLVRVDGDAVLSLEAIFLEDWLATTGKLVELEQDLPARETAALRLADAPDTQASSDGPLVQFIPSGPRRRRRSRHRRPVRRCDRKCAGALLDRHAVLHPGRGPGHPAAHGGPARRRRANPRAQRVQQRQSARRLRRPELLRRPLGGRLPHLRVPARDAAREYMIIDAHLAAIGSANMDVRSFYINYEVTAMFYDPTVTESVATVFQQDLEHAREVLREQRTSLPTSVRLLEASARVLSPLL